jgi:hypothetical protein
MQFIGTRGRCNGQRIEIVNAVNVRNNSSGWREMQYGYKNIPLHVRDLDNWYCELGNILSEVRFIATGIQ